MHQIESRLHLHKYLRTPGMWILVKYSSQSMVLGSKLNMQSSGVFIAIVSLSRSKFISSKLHHHHQERKEIQKSRVLRLEVWSGLIY
jgi:hypothetical protein